ncbi:hypothetical protein WISP_133104 [Willisornis vidua]|uniref:RNA-directed DNA polymerase from mobile element jockey n=1 Tax=Willisornis vidua TaxID=1566151 RepID=A0ABQ9CS32_9PASS|nr:hypothetical protein WISP_133104 [Willisornis vidua]
MKKRSTETYELVQLRHPLFRPVIKDKGQRRRKTGKLCPRDEEGSCAPAKSYKSMEPDGIHLKILKVLADVILKTLLMIFEWSSESGEVPADWKLVNVVLVFKKNKKEDPGNYSPVSLTSVPGQSHGVKESTLDSESQGPEFESQWGPSPGSKRLPAIPSRQISDAKQCQPRLVLGAVDSPEDFPVTVQACLAMTNGP